MRKIILSIVFLCLFSVNSFASAPSPLPEKIKVREVVMNAATATLREGHTSSLSAHVLPRNAHDAEITWDSSDYDTVFVSAKGVIEALKPGTATITASVENGKSSTCVVTVIAAVKVDDVDMDALEKRLSSLQVPVLNKGEEISAVSLRYDVRNAIKKAGGNNAKLTYKNISLVSAKALSTSGDIAKEEKVSLAITFQTLRGEKAVQGQIKINPTLIKSSNKTIKLGVYTVHSNISSAAEKIKKQFPKGYSAILLEQNGSYGMTVSVAAKPDLKKLDSKNLTLYRYDSKSEKYIPLENQKYSIDKSGFIHFSTEYGGMIVFAN